MSLVEVIVVIALIGIISIPLMQIMETNNNIIVSEREKSDATNIALLIEEYIKNNVRTAKQVVLTNKQSDQLPNSIYVDGNEVIHKVGGKVKTIIASRALLKQFDIKVNFKIGEKNTDILVVDIQVIHNEEIIVQISTEIEMINNPTFSVESEENNCILFDTY